ncbi:hypothetical protein AVEN_107462-1, partial [Araneus ventricosus]
RSLTVSPALRFSHWSTSDICGIQGAAPCPLYHYSKQSMRTARIRPPDIPLRSLSS